MNNYRRNIHIYTCAEADAVVGVSQAMAEAPAGRSAFNIPVLFFLMSTVVPCGGKQTTPMEIEQFGGSESVETDFHGSSYI